MVAAPFARRPPRPRPAFAFHLRVPASFLCSRLTFGFPPHLCVLTSDMSRVSAEK
ncbi:hypothetical protein HMPREF0682_0864 [Propionibacterium acidifaciens F0233]|uniref:Uncharacterized protein n=1 Tax=Propionibacterium acidifaciens F0233 TaxID=553198 RepID=U2PND0_9ACTN|nr:hypothetical protein HMPREF0682_0864 [Propionibacterium acidifaciens F0233]